MSGFITGRWVIDRVGRRWSARDAWDRCDTWDRGFWRGSLSRSRLWLTWDRCDTWDRRVYRGCASVCSDGLLQAGVTGGGIEAARWRGQLPHVVHALEGFAHVVVVEAADGAQAAGVQGRGAVL